MRSNIQEEIKRLQVEASHFITSSKLDLEGLFIYPKEIEVYYYKVGEFEDNSVHKNELQIDNRNHFYIHRFGTKRSDSYKGGNYAGLDFVVSDDKSIYYTYLIRSALVNGILEIGPHKVLNAIKAASNLTEKELEMKTIETCPNETTSNVLFSSRRNLGKTVYEEYLNCKLRAVLCDEFYRHSKYPAKEKMIIDFLYEKTNQQKITKEQALQYAKEKLGYIPSRIRAL